jgi:hypothetical protein
MSESWAWFLPAMKLNYENGRGYVLYRRNIFITDFERQYRTGSYFASKSRAGCAAQQTDARPGPLWNACNFAALRVSPGRKAGDLPSLAAKLSSNFGRRRILHWRFFPQTIFYIARSSACCRHSGRA